MFRLNEDAYVAYVYETGDYTIADMMRTGGERYGLLLDSDFNILARMPCISDITEDGGILFDDKMGTLRYSRIYSLEELMTMAK